MSKDVIIIGAGPGGLASAILLAAAGVKVKVLERLPTVGGRTSTIEADGFKFDLGPTFFLYPRVLEEIFAAAGTSLRDEVEMVRLDPQYRIIFGERRRDSTRRRTSRAWSSRSPRSRQATRRASAASSTRIAPSSSAWSRASESPFLGWQDLINMRLLKMLPMLRPHQSVDTYLGRFFRDPRIRLAFSFQSKYLGMSPFRCPSLFSILSFLEYEYGVFHPIGGCAAVTAAMARVAERLGVEIRTDSPVEEVLFEGRRAVGVRTAAGVEKRGRDRDERRLRPRDEAPRARPPAPPLDGPQDRAQEILLLDLHDVSRRRGRVRPAASQHPHRRGLRAQPRRDREPARPLRRSLVLRAERVRHRPDARAARA